MSELQEYIIKKIEAKILEHHETQQDDILYDIKDLTIDLIEATKNVKLKNGILDSFTYGK